MIAMRVPGLIVRAARTDGDQADAGLDQAPRQQHALPQVRQPTKFPRPTASRIVTIESVPLANLGCFRGQIEGFARRRRSDQRVGLLVEGIHPLE